MNYEKYLSEINQLFDDAKAVLTAKMKDYTGGGDPLSNFKTAGKDAGIGTVKAWYVYAYKHWTALSAFARNGKLESEPIKGRIIDLINYAVILWMIIQEEKHDLNLIDRTIQ